MNIHRSLFCFLVLTPLLWARPLELPKIRQAIQEQGAQWTAQENDLTRLSSDARAQRLGLLVDEPQIPDHAPLVVLPPVESLPDSFDWRHHNGNWVTPVRDQGACGSCWAFSALAQVEAWWKIQHDEPDTTLDLSEQFLLSCSDAGNCEQGGYIHKSLTFMQTNPLPLERYLPYQAQSDIPCLPPDGEWTETAVTIPGWGYITFGEAQVENIKKALLHHPVSASFEVFSDFYSYHSGVYEHVFGGSQGWHAVLIVGWNDREQSWIVKNSWGDSWGEAGYFRIKWGDSNFGMRNPFIWDQWSSGILQTSTAQIVDTLTYGDIDTAYFDIHNISDTTVEFYCLESWPQENTEDWLTIEEGAGTLASGERQSVRVIFKTRDVSPGEFKKRITVSTNSSVQPELSVACRLLVERPSQDAHLEAIHLPEAGFPLLSWSSCSATLRNIGTHLMTNLGVVCDITLNDQPFATDTVHVGLLAGQKSKTIEFPAFKTTRTGNLSFRVFLLPTESDYNAFNNQISDSAEITHRVDSFEHTTDRWTAQGGWGFSDVYNGHSGSMSAHVNNGSIPYSNDMNTVLTFTPGFELAGLDTLFVTYWTRYVTADSNDICVVETSGDSMTWQAVDTYTGTHPAWQQRVINLSDYAQQDLEKAWIRFRFISDSQGNSIGVLIDDIEAFMETLNISNPPPQTRVSRESSAPQQWALLPNYPNPFNPATTLSFSLPHPADITLAIFNTRGQRVDVATDGHWATGTHHITWDAQEFPSGLYFYTLEAHGANGESYVARQKMLLIR